MAQHILVTGASGLVGTPLLAQLQAAGHTVSVLSRSKKPGSPYPVFTWDYQNDFLEEGALEGRATADGSETPGRLEPDGDAAPSSALWKSPSRARVASSRALP